MAPRESRPGIKPWTPSSLDQYANHYIIQIQVLEQLKKPIMGIICKNYISSLLLYLYQLNSYAQWKIHCEHFSRGQRTNHEVIWNKIHGTQRCSHSITNKVKLGKNRYRQMRKKEVLYVHHQSPKNLNLAEKLWGLAYNKIHHLFEYSGSTVFTAKPISLQALINTSAFPSTVLISLLMKFTSRSVPTRNENLQQSVMGWQRRG